MLSDSRVTSSKNFSIIYFIEETSTTESPPSESLLSNSS